MVRLCRGGWRGRGGGAAVYPGIGTGLRSESLGRPWVLELPPLHSPASPAPIHFLQLTKPCSVFQATVQWCHSQGNSRPFSPGWVGGGPGLPSPKGVSGRKGRQGTCQEIPGFHEAERGWLLGSPHTPQSRAQGCLLGPWGGHQEHPEGRKIRGRTLTRADLSAQKLLGTFLPSKYLDSEMDGQVTARPGRPGCRIF